VRRVTLIAVCLVVSQAFGGTTFKPTTTLTAETSSNTSTAATFTGEANGNIPGANISKVPTRSLLYKGSTAKLFAHFMPWFGFGSHVDVGYASNDPAQVQRQVNDMVSRGLDGVVVDWYGAAAHFAPYDQATQLIRQQAELHPGFTFAIMEDGGALKACAGTVGCDVTQTLITDLNYVNAMYEGSPAYLRFNGQPVIYFFGDSAYTIDWTRVRANVAGNPVFVFRNNGGFTHAQSGGGFSWLATQSIFTPSTTDPASLGYLSSYYGTALTHPALYSTGSAYKGFNDSIAAWNANRYISQQCGQTWLQSMADAGNYYSIADQMFGVQIVTWNDYEEGTEIESGIEDCVVVSPKMVGGWLTWNTSGNENGVDHYTVYISQDGQSLMPLKDLPAFDHAFEVGNLGLGPGSYILYVQALGKASIVNHMSPAVGFHPNDQTPIVQMAVDGSQGLTVNVSTNGSSDPDGVVTGSQIDFGDGTVAPGPSATHTYQKVGAYEVTATVWDNLGAFGSSRTRITAKPSQQGITISSPTDGATQNFPNPFVVSANSAAPVTGLAVYVGDQLAYLTDQDFINTPLKVFKGYKTITVQAWDAAGNVQRRQFTVNAEPQDAPAQAVVDVYPIPSVAPLAVIACTARSSDPDGFILQTITQFSDGFTTYNRGVLHIFSQPGTYGVTTAAIDQFGAGDTAQTSITVK